MGEDGLNGSVPSTEPIVEIRFAYDTIKGDYIEDDTSYYEYSEIMKTEYEVSIFPIDEELQSPFETSSENDNQLDTGEYKGTVTQQDSARCNQSKANGESTEATGTITLITRNKDHAQTSLVEAYFNSDKSAIMVDTCSSVSIIHYNDPAKDRIFKSEKEGHTTSFAKAMVTGENPEVIWN